MRIFWSIFTISFFISVKAPACELNSDYAVRSPFALSILQELHIPTSSEIEAESSNFESFEINPLLNLQHALQTIEPHLSNCENEMRVIFGKLIDLKLVFNRIAQIQSNITFVSNDSEFSNQMNTLNIQIADILKTTSVARVMSEVPYKIIVNIQSSAKTKRRKIRYIESDANSIRYDFYMENLNLKKIDTIQSLTKNLRRMYSHLPIRFRRDIPFKSTHFFWAYFDSFGIYKLGEISSWAFYLILVPAILFGLFKYTKDLRVSQID